MKQTFVRHIVAITIFSISVSCANAANSTTTAPEIQTEGMSSWLADFKIEPQLMQSKGSAQDPSLGLTYKIDIKPIIDAVKPWGLMSLSTSAEGAYATHKEDNPDNLVKAKLEGETLIDVALSPRLFATAAYTGTQGAQRAFIAAASASVKYDLPAALPGFIIPRFGFERVHPTKDDPRKAVLGRTDDFSRWNFSVLGIVRINIGGIDRFETVYNYFKEVNAPQTLAAAHLDRYRLATYYIRLKNGAFVAYTSGTLPADRVANPTFKVGWSSDLVQK